MGLSVSAATAIIGVSILISLEFMVANVIPTFTDTDDAYKEMKDRAIDKLQTDINITSITSTGNASNYDLNFTVKNTGSVSLEISYFNILVDGNEYSFTAEKDYLYPEKTSWFNITDLSGSDSATLKIVTDNGISEYSTFSVPGG